MWVEGLCKLSTAVRREGSTVLRTAHLWTSGDGQDELVGRLIPMCRDVVRDAFRRRESAPTVWDEQVGREERPSMLTETTFLTAEIKKRLPRPVCEGLQALKKRGSTDPDESRAQVPSHPTATSASSHSGAKYVHRSRSR